MHFCCSIAKTCMAFPRAFFTTAAEGEASTAGKPSRKLFLYSKDNCPLCDGLKVLFNCTKRPPQ